MGQIPSPEATRNMTNFLLNWHAEREAGTLLSSARGVLPEELGLTEEEFQGTDVLSVRCTGDVWRVEVRLPSGVRAAASCRRSYLQARAKAIRLGRLTGRREAS